MKKSFYTRLKSITDRFFGIVLLLLAMPVMILICLIIMLDSKGSLIFSQVRIGKNRKRFVFYKFRTMYLDARAQYPNLYRYKYSSKEVKLIKFKIENDPRLTNFGRYIRRTSLDELPNLINVIKGEMSLIGPRPEIPEMLPYYRQDQLVKFSVKPGITGIAQTEGRGYLTLQETIKCDIKYVKNQSLLLDLRILFKTVLIVLRGTGAF